MLSPPHHAADRCLADAEFLRYRSLGQNALTDLGTESLELAIQFTEAARYSQRQRQGYDIEGRDGVIRHYPNEAAIQSAVDHQVLTLDQIHKTPGLENWKPVQRPGGAKAPKPTKAQMDGSYNNLQTDFNGGHFPAPSDITQYVQMARSYYGWNDAQIQANISANRPFWIPGRTWLYTDKVKAGELCPSRS